MQSLMSWPEAPLESDVQTQIARSMHLQFCYAPCAARHVHRILAHDEVTGQVLCSSKPIPIPGPVKF